MPCKRKLIVLLLAAVFLSGCSIQTVDKLYSLPKRSQEEGSLQSAIDSAMEDLSYCAPLTGENQQAVQSADLDGDGTAEYLLFAKGADQQPLRILIFRKEQERYVLAETIASNGSAFDQVEYVPMDDHDGVELVVGRQVSEQVLRSLTVYTFTSGQAEQVMTASYTKYLCSDLDSDGRNELFLLRSGDTETENGIAELYAMENGSLERFNVVNMSGPVDRLKRIITGQLFGGLSAVYVASSVEENAIITDVYTIVDGEFRNISLSNESGTSIQTLRSYYVYAEDIDNDNVVELPDLIPMLPVGEAESEEQQLIRWYAMGPDGAETDKTYTFHNFAGGWYLELAQQWADRLTVVRQGSSYDFYLWNEERTEAEKALRILEFTGPERGIQAVSDGRFELYSADSVIYAVELEPASGQMSITVEQLRDAFHLIRQAWKTGET